jgi:hypothetical protein
VRGFLAIALGLIALQVFTTSSLPDLVPAVAYPAGLVAKWMDPTVPLIPAGSSSSTAAGSSAPAATPKQTAAQQQGSATAGLSALPDYIGGAGVSAP